ncbi:uncharacterized protein AMSG_00584 [Thecamonas trahens ATCC 50062]|uniref:Uncharacterized protein n=1 Tax=Thecamonas trahens ATCC 50062 TaxID=461836 RepID=A0A0L0D8Y5_THETB|nr:hypothetical protein AMSG_00584 [Thecamonas trahens ATCC 50062]KNC48804.1 hypothetical protein AMSG_00584 [Thecamonas trahens ATCC 50062]|eukprot:XP_013762855.1 hypothetical protein AMSG_00584 [Thecamonas trahens ATCC 50062]
MQGFINSIQSADNTTLSRKLTKLAKRLDAALVDDAPAEVVTKLESKLEAVRAEIEARAAAALATPRPHAGDRNCNLEELSDAELVRLRGKSARKLTAAVAKGKTARAGALCAAVVALEAEMARRELDGAGNESDGSDDELLPEIPVGATIPRNALLSAPTLVLEHLVDGHMRLGPADEAVIHAELALRRSSGVTPANVGEHVAKLLHAGKPVPTAVVRRLVAIAMRR